MQLFFIMKSYNFCSTVDDVDDDDVERVWTFCLLMFFWINILTHVENVIFLISQKRKFWFVRIFEVHSMLVYFVNDSYNIEIIVTSCRIRSLS